MPWCVQRQNSRNHKEKGYKEGSTFGKDRCFRRLEELMPLQEVSDF